jgi:PPP family 3-phenylpropionic acid transporter
MRALTFLLGNGPTSGPLGVRIASFFGALFLAYGVVVPYFPVWLHSRGLDPFQISTITAAPLFLRTLVTPSIGLLADRLGDYRAVIMGLAWGAFAMILGLGLACGYLPILVLGVAFLMMNGTMVPLIETVAVRAVRSDGLEYGRMRLWGSMTFIVANFIGGIAIEALGGGVALWMMGAAALVTVAAGYALPRASGTGPAPVRGRIDWRSSGPARLLRSRLFVLFLIAIGCIHGAHATFYTFGALYWQSQGLPAAWVGALWGIGVFAEVLLFAFSAPVVRRFGPLQLITIGAAVSVLRWTAMAFDPPLSVLVPLQVLHALTYGATHLGAILFITRAVPHAAMGTAQAFYSTIAAGLVLGIVGLISGALYGSIGGLVFLVPAVVSAIGLVAAVLLLRGWHGATLWGDTGEGISPTTQAQEA